IDAGRENERVITLLERVHVERPFDSVFAVAAARTADVVYPQIALDRRLSEYNSALAFGIPTAGSALQAENVAAHRRGVGNGHTCAFLGQPANNGVHARCRG